jgi:sugar phosphate isomerase/epimerase
MKLALSTLGCPNWSLEQIVAVAREHGYGGLDFRGLGAEIDVTRLPAFNDDLPATIDLLKRHELRVACFNTSVTLVTPAPERWQMMLDECQRNARLCERLHTRFIRVFGGQLPRDVTHDEAIVLARRHARQLVKVCQPYGCQIVLETHDYWSPSSRAMELVHEFAPDEVGLLWDIEHPWRKNETPIATYETLKRYLKHVHFKDSHRVPDPNRPEGRSIPKLIGEGELPVADFWRVLTENQYDGWVTLESEKRWHADGPEPEQIFPQFARWVRAQS